MSEFGFGLKEIFFTLWSGMLGLLWYDIRGLRKQRPELRKEMDDEFLTKKTHTLLCANTVIQFKLDLLAVKNEIIQAIKDNGACNGCESNTSHPEK